MTTTAKTDTAGKGKKLNVQVPGDTASDTTAKTDTADDASSIAVEKPEVTLADVALAAEPAVRPARNFRDMHAHEIDPTTLTAPVLTKDGWVCPFIPDKK